MDTIFTPDVFRLTVDRRQSLDEMIAAGLYNWKNRNIDEKNFPIRHGCVVTLEARFFSFPSIISIENAARRIVLADTKKLWMPAKIEYVLALGKTFPHEQCNGPIFGLGSETKVDGGRCVPYLDSNGSRRYLRLGWWDTDRGPDCRFLAVRAISAP